MKTKKKYDINQHLHTEEALETGLHPILEVQIGEPQKHTRVIHTKETIQITCPKCKSPNFKKDGKIKTSRVQRYRCKSCTKSFSLSAACVNLDELFLHHYDSLHKDESYMLKTKMRKMTVNQHSKSYMRFFKGRIKELNAEGKFSVDEIIKQAFKETNLYIDKQEQVTLSKQKDTFAFFMNYKNMDISYHTEFEHYQLVRNDNINLHKEQSPFYPLFFCECGSVNLRRHGANNNARSRLKCQSCNKIFVIRLKNVVPKAYFHSVFKEMFRQFVPWFKKLDQLEEQLAYDFYNTEFHTYFEELITRIELFTHRTRYYIMKLFINMQLMRLLEYLRVQINKKAYNERKISNVQYVGEVKDINFLKTDEKVITDIIVLCKGFEQGVPEIFDIDNLLENAVKQSSIMSDFISRSKVKI